MLKKRTGNLVNLKASVLNIHLLSIDILGTLEIMIKDNQIGNFLVCMTNGGTIPNKPCVFPFNYKGTDYTTCTNVGEDFSWCSTKVDSDGNHIGGNWGSCEPTCPNYMPPGIIHIHCVFILQ